MMAEKHKDEQERRHITVYLTHLRYVALEIDGKDLIRLGLPPGPHYRTVLDTLHRYFYSSCLLLVDSKVMTRAGTSAGRNWTARSATRRRSSGWRGSSLLRR
jgi:hypothetical protein